jgi:predicted chitinase
LPIDSLTQRPPIAALDNAVPDSTQSAPVERATLATAPMAPDSVAIADPTHQDGLRNLAKATPARHATTNATSKPTDSPPPVDPKRRADLVAKLVAQVPASDREAAKKAIPAILNAARQNGVTDPNQIGYILATAGLESRMGGQMKEIGKASDLDARDRNYNGNTLPDDGSRYRGRGFVQTTYKGGYAAISQRLGLGNVPVTDRNNKPVLDSNGNPKTQPYLVANPQKLETNVDLAANALVVGIKDNVYTHNASAALSKTIPAGNAPGDADFVKARGIVNGYNKDDANYIAANAPKFAQILDGYRHSVLGVPGVK